MPYTTNYHYQYRPEVPVKPYCDFIKPSDDTIARLRHLCISENRRMGLCWMDLSTANEMKRFWPNILTLRKILKRQNLSDFTFNLTKINDAMVHVSLSDDPDAWTVEEILRLPDWVLVG
jgi:hypothetical protein